MKDIKEFYILGLPIETEIGICNFLKVKEYPDYYAHLQYISLAKDQIIENLINTLKINSNDDIDDKTNVFIEQMRNEDLFSIVFS